MTAGPAPWWRRRRRASAGCLKPLAATPVRRDARVLWLALAGVAALGFGVAAALLVKQPTPTHQDGATLLAVTLPDPEGVLQPLAQWQGKVLVVNFWATWCAPCREEMPLFVQAQAKHGGQGLQFVGIAVDDAGKAKQFANDIGVNYPTLIGGYGAMELSKTLGNKLMALPFTVVIGRSGSVELRHLGPIKAAQLDDLLKQLL